MPARSATLPQRPARSTNGDKPQLDKPVFELVKATPPDPPPKNVTITERVRPFLEEILEKDDRDWYRLAIYPGTGAGQGTARLTKTYSNKEWEFRSVQLREVGQSAIYVRWIGKASRVP